MTSLAHLTAPVLKLPASATYEEWLAAGRNLATAKLQWDWLIGDWLNHGRKHFPEQMEFALEGLGIDQRHLKRIEKTVEAFPPHLRDKRLSFDHHAHVADLPTEEALPLLKEARKEHLPASKLRIRAMLKKVETGRILPREDDADDDALVALCRAWNRATRPVRQEFADMVAESDLGIIDP